MENSKISWTDHTQNWWIGCTKVGAPCDNCYAEDMMDHRYGTVRWGAGQPRLRTGPANWRKPVGWNRRAIETGTRPFVFSLSLGDIWDNEVDPKWRWDAFEVMRRTPALVWLLLSKRIGNAVEMAIQAGGLPPNCALGMTVGDQRDYDRDIGKLEQAETTLNPLFTFGSFEPLLGPVRLDERAPDWIIVGGESGPRARPMDPRWARDLRDDAYDHGRTFLFKQQGGRDIKKGGDLLDGRRHQDRPRVPALGVVS